MAGYQPGGAHDAVEIARIALISLIQDGRIHPGRIEELVEKVKVDMDEKLLSDGEAAALEAGIPRARRALGRIVREALVAR